MPNLDAIARAKVGPVRGPFSRQLGSWIKRARSRALTRTSTRKYGEEIWRRVRDSNPRYGFPYAGFQDGAINHSANSPGYIGSALELQFGRTTRKTFLPVL